MQIIYQNEALGISFSEKLVLRSFEVTQGQKLRKRVKFQYFFKVGKLYLKMKPLTRPFQKSYSQGNKRSSKVKSREKSPKKVKFLSFSKMDKCYLKMKLLARIFQENKS